MDSQDKHPYELAKEVVLSNDLLTKWLMDLKEQLRKIESSLSLDVTGEVSQAELAETKSENEE
jgi:hypothetical protein